MADQNFRVKRGLEVGLGATVLNALPSGLVGVGTTNPGAKLDVLGGIVRVGYQNLPQISGNVNPPLGPGTITAYGSIVAGVNTAYNSQFAAVGLGTTNGELAIYSFYPNFANFPTDRQPRRAADIIGGYSTGVWGTEYLAFNVGNNGSPNDGGALTVERLRINQTGVGIGTSNPTSALYVVGDTYVTGILTANRIFSSIYGEFTGGSISGSNIVGTSLSISGISTLGTVQISSGIITATSGVVTYYGDGSKLSGVSVSSAVSISTNTTNSNQYIPYATSFGSTTGFGATTLLVYNPSSGNLGIGTTNPLQKLHILGNLLVAVGSSTGQHITQKAYELNSGTLSWEGSAGQLFSITNNLTSGSIFSVNDVSGIPSIDVNADGTVTLAPYADGNVGIATTRPTSRLHVIGDGLIVGVLTATSFSGNASSATYATSSGIATYASTAGIATYATTAGISTYATSAGIATNLKGGAGGSIPYQSDADTTTFLANGSSGQILQSNGGTSAPSWVNAAPAGAITGLTIRDEGTIIGTANSVSQLNFVGNIVSATSTAGIATITFLDYVSNAGIATYASTAGVATSVLTNPGVGIATAGGTVGTGATIIDFRGSGISTVTVSAGIATINIIDTSGGGGGTIAITDDTSTNATYYVGIANTTTGNLSTLNVSSTKLTFNPSTGNLVAGGTVTANSDEKLKTDIRTIENALHKVLSLRGVEFTRIDTGDNQIGVIAQEVEKVIPEVVYPKSAPDYETKSVAYANLVGLLIEAVKEQNQRIVELERKLEEK